MITNNSSSNPTSFVDLDNARLDEQKQVMQEIQNQEHCPFCLENLRKYHKQEILKEGKYWLITPNQWPYEHTKIHYLAIYKTHAEHLQEIEPAAGAELIQFFAEIEKAEKIPGGGLALRFGSTDYSAGTVRHIHAQFIVPDIDQPDFEPVRFKIGKGKK